jgi:hypothetical protein
LDPAVSSHRDCEQRFPSEATIQLNSPIGIIGIIGTVLYSCKTTNENEPSTQKKIDDETYITDEGTMDDGSDSSLFGLVRR